MRLAYGSVLVVVTRAHGSPIDADDDLARTRIGSQVHAILERVRPVRQVRGREGTLRASECAPTAVVAGRAPAVGLRGDGLLGGPPVPTELLVRIHEQLARPSQRRWRIGERIPVGAAWVACEAGHANNAFVDRVIGRQV